MRDWERPPANDHPSKFRWLRGALKPCNYDSSPRLCNSLIAPADGATVFLLQSITPMLQQYTHTESGLWFKQAIDLYRNKKVPEAVECLQALLNQWPTFAPAWHLLAVLASERGDDIQSIEWCSRALTYDDKNADCWRHRGVSQMKLGKFELAILDFEQSLARAPNLAITWFYKGHCERSLSRWEESIHSIHQGYQLDKTNASVLLPLALNLESLARYEECVQVLKFIGAHSPHDAWVHWNLGLIYLKLGCYSEGWELYEWRFKLEGYGQQHPHLEFPILKGKPMLDLAEPIKGRRVLLLAEQGSGDNIQYLRFVLKLQDLGAHIIFGGSEIIKPLVSNCGFGCILNFGDQVPEFECYCPILSLPKVLKINETNLAHPPYIQVEPKRRQRWERLMQKHLESKQIRVGLVWQGGDRKGSMWVRVNQLRQITFAQMATLQNLPVDFYNLQFSTKNKADWPHELATTWRGSHFIDLVPEIEDFADTAALIEQLHLVITVDTSVAHLAGAMGKNVWLLNRFESDWRWLVNRTDSPWYATMTLYNQPVQGDWASVFRAIKQDLASLRLQDGHLVIDQQALLGAKQLIDWRADEFFNRANVNKSKAWYDDAIPLYKNCLAINPKASSALNNLGNLYVNVHQFPEALDCLSKNIALNPESCLAYINRSAVWIAMYKLEESIQDIYTALTLDPAHIDGWQNLGVIWQTHGRFWEALFAAEMSCVLHESSANVRNSFYGIWNRACIWLTLGYWSRGWVEHESRWYLDKALKQRELWDRKTEWLGQVSLEGKIIVVYTEQGLGDSIMFARYLKYLKYLEPQKIIFLVQEPLAELLENLAGVDEIYAYPITRYIAHDYHCALLGLPLALSKYVPHIPPSLPFIRVSEKYRQLWAHKWTPSHKKRLGVVWEGGEGTSSNFKRNIRLQDLMYCLEEFDVEVHSLQKGTRAKCTSQMRHTGIYCNHQI
ncbi:MAG: tetratricopeptide repeat protein, partial [Gammaproteobacteria bacterium]|nr:tetratricopeptide repeat protein [Gammaproteobacteria bacterium]